MRKMKKRAISPQKMKTQVSEFLHLTTKFKNLLGIPELRGGIYLQGDTAMGKSTFLMQLCKEIATQYKVDYNSLEEEDRASMQALMLENKMHECKKGRFMLLNGWSYEELIERLRKKRSARVIVIDSIQYLNITTKQYKALIAEFNNKLFIFNSHAEGKKAVGSLARDIKFDCDVKLFAEGFKISSRSRMSRGTLTTDYIVWDEGARRYWEKI